LTGDWVFDLAKAVVISQDVFSELLAGLLGPFAGLRVFLPGMVELPVDRDLGAPFGKLFWKSSRFFWFRVDA
jgi:hypothetical protein